MQMLFRRLAAIIAVLIMAGACTDTPTEPAAALPGGSPLGDELQGCVVDGVCVLPPIGSGGGGWCDPRVSDCGDGGWGTCLNSGSIDGADAINSCPGDDGGGGGGGGDGDDSPYPPPDEESGFDDYHPMVPPDCTKAVLLPWEHAYCTSEVPTGERLTRTLSALDRIAARGGECTNVAEFGRTLLQAGQLRYYPYVESIHGNYGGWGHPSIGAILDTGWVDAFGGTPTGAPNFDRKLIHEIEHAMGRNHIDTEGVETPNSAACAGFS